MYKDLLTSCNSPSPAACLLLLPLTASTSSSLNFPRVFHCCVLAGFGGPQLFRFLIHLHVAARLYLVSSANASMWADIWSMFFMREIQLTRLMSPVDDCATLTERLQLLSDSQRENSRVFLKDLSPLLSFSPYNTFARPVSL